MNEIQLSRWPAIAIAAASIASPTAARAATLYVDPGLASDCLGTYEPTTRQCSGGSETAYASLATAAGGQSGHPASPHYADQSKLWVADEYHPLLMDIADIEANLEGTLTIEPESGN